jgi:hypothetical protein
MAIQITTLKGTSSISADRITLNDNFKIITDTINQLLGIVNVVTGKIDNSTVGTNGTITTNGITVNISGLEIVGGDINLGNGNLIIAKSGSYIKLGQDNSQIKDTLIGSSHILEFPNFAGISLPRLTTSNITNITGGLSETGPNIMVFNTDTNKPQIWNGFLFVDLI